jgi:hypothetical protein
VTKPRNRWLGELDKPITTLPVAELTHGGAVKPETADEFNAKAQATIDAALNKIRLNKLPLLADHYNVGKQAYAALAKALATEFVRNFDGDVHGLRKTYVVDDNKSLALALAAKYVPGFQYKPAKIAAESAALFTDVDTKEERLLATGAMRAVHTGRPTIWDSEMLLALLAAVEKARRPGETVRDVLRSVRRKEPWRAFDLETLESRYHDAKNEQKRQQAIAQKANELLGSMNFKRKR